MSIFVYLCLSEHFTFDTELPGGHPDSFSLQIAIITCDKIKSVLHCCIVFLLLLHSCLLCAEWQTFTKIHIYKIIRSLAVFEGMIMSRRTLTHCSMCNISFQK